MLPLTALKAQSADEVVSGSGDIEFDRNVSVSQPVRQTSVNLQEGVILYFLLKNITFCVLLGAAGEAGLFLLYKKQPTAYDGLVGRVIDSISIIDRFYDFVYEQFSVASAVYYISITALFVFLTIQVVNKRRWS